MSVSQIAAELPGISFERVAPPLDETLPRMDIAGLVGFASAGPMDVPVAVESIERFRELFGPDVTLAWDAEQGVFDRSYLGSAVEGFFQNGGQRCWVVRVGDRFKDDRPVAGTHQFPLPHVWRPVDPAPDVSETGWAPLSLQARSAGTWADDLQLGTVLHGQPLPLREITIDWGSGETRTVAADFVAFPGTPVPGDLIELTLYDRAHEGDEAASAYSPMIVYVFVDRRSPLPRGWRIQAEAAFAFEPTATSPAASDTRGTSLPLTPLDAEQAESIWVAWRLANPLAVPMARLLQLELLGWRDEAIVARLPRLGFAADHPRFWGWLPDDERLFARHASDAELFAQPSISPQRATELKLLWRDASEPRFPFASAELGVPVYSVPLGMPTRPLAADAVSAVPRSDSRQNRNGVGAWQSAPFLDQRMLSFGSRTVVNEAEHRAFVERESLRGLHALSLIDEVTLVAVPDAVHRSWEPTLQPRPEILTAPGLQARVAPAGSRARLEWTAIPTADRYELQVAQSTDFCRLEFAGEFSETAAEWAHDLSCEEPRSFRVRALRGTKLGPWSNTRTLSLPLEDFHQCPAPPSPSEWCVRLQVEEIAVGSPATTRRWQLQWRPEHADGEWPRTTDRFELQRASEVEFLTAEPVELQAGAVAREVDVAPDTVAWFRVRMIRDELTGPWSETVGIVGAPLSQATLVHPRRYDDEPLIDVHRALLRLSAGRGDWLAVFALPLHFRTEEVLQYLDALTPGGSSGSAVSSRRPPPLTLGEEDLLSFAALYHPWVTTTRVAETGRGAPGGPALTPVPPDGAMCGILAKTAITDGPWRAPANQPLADVLARTPEFNDDDWSRLTARRTNVVRQEPRDIRVLSAETLSADRDLHLINVRRLVSLLRRLALREGVIDLFEPNGAVLRDQVRQRFERLLSDLFVRGAFAGDTPEAGYRVVTDESINPPTSVDQGRLIIELQVAPSRPLSFLRIRLLQEATDQFRISQSR